MFGKRQKRKTAIVKFVKIIVESSNAVAIGYAPILRLPSGFLSDFFVKKRPTFRPPLQRISRSTFRPVCRPVITPPVDGYQGRLPQSRNGPTTVINVIFTTRNRPPTVINVIFTSRNRPPTVIIVVITS
ncbi:unnamed protein product [Sphagnum tenellum]